MVRSDCESSDPPRYLQLLHDAHSRAITLLGKDLEAGLIQFSDSIVFSRPFELTALGQFLETVTTWQRSLLCDGLLCRGGVTFGKHFVRDRFLFSKGMIDAYHLEAAQARYPRVVVSDNLLQLAGPSLDISELRLLKEEDGVVFVDYLFTDATVDGATLVAATHKILNGSPHGDAAIQEKMRWLARYSDHKLGSSFSGPRFVTL